MSTFAQIMHVVAKDARRFWPLAVLVVGVLALDLAFEPAAPRYIAGPVGYMVGGLGIRGLVFGLLTVLVTTLVVHEDEVASGQAFWSSRPISPGALLAAKLVLVAGLLLVVPLAFQSAAILDTGTGERLMPQLAESALYQGALLVLIMALASVTNDLKSTLILGVVGYVGLGLMTSFWMGSRFDWLVAGRLGPSREFAGRVVWLSLGGIALAYQFLSGRSRVALAGLVLVLSLTAFVSARMPYDFTGDGTPAVALALPPAEMQIRAVALSRSLRSGDDVRDGIDVVVGTTPSEYAIAPRTDAVSVRLNRGGRVETLAGQAVPYRPTARYLPELAEYERLGTSPDWAQFDFRILLAARSELAAAFQEVDGVTVGAEWDAFTRRIVGRLPLGVGAELSEGPARIRVERVELLPTSAEVVVATTWVRSSLATSRDDRADRIRMVLVNDRLRQVLMVSSGGTSQSAQGLILGGPSAVTQRTTLSYTFGNNPDLVYGVTAAWFEDASVLVFANEYVGTFSDEVSADASGWDFGRLATASRFTPMSTIADGVTIGR